MSNSENAFQKAESQLERQEKSPIDSNELLSARADLVRPINAAINSTSRDAEMKIPDYVTAEEKSLSLSIKKQGEFRGALGSREDLIIEGRLASEAASVPMPMYKVSKSEHYTDGGKLNDHYAVFVTNNEGGYEPIALLEQTILHSNLGGIDEYKVMGSARVSYDVFKAHDHLTEMDMQELKETGMWIDPRATDLLAEVKDILGLVASQEQLAT